MSGSGPGTFRQDLPPPGGYKPIPYERIPAKTLIKARPFIAAYLGITVGSYYLYTLNAQKTKRLQMEMRGARLAIVPMLRAEKDRAYLTQLRKNRDEEARLMKDVPGWVVGTYFGTPIYEGRDPDEWHDVTPQEMFCHTHPWYGRHSTEFHKWV